MTQLNHTTSRADLSDAVVAAYIHEISARHANTPSGPAGRRGDRPDPTHRRFGARRSPASQRRPGVSPRTSRTAVHARAAAFE
jgi:hypothetical protein